MARITDDEWADLVAHELPKPSDIVIQKYIESRSALIAEEQKQRSDHTFRQALSPIARKACAMLSKIRDEEKREGHSNTSHGVKKSWQIIRRMPKGALLRAHCHSLVDIDHLLEVALSTPGIHISCSDGTLASAEAKNDAGLSVRFRKSQGNPPNYKSPWTDDYKPGTFTPLSRAAESYPDGGKEGFIYWLKKKCRTTRQIDDAWDPQQATSRCSALVDGMLYYEPIWRAFLQRLMGDLVKDGVYWLELLFPFPLAYYRTGSDTSDPDYDHMFQTLEEEVASFQATPSGRPFWGLRVIWSTTTTTAQTHFQGASRTLIEDADSCIATKLMYPHLVAGYAPTTSRPLANLLPELFWFRKQCAMENVQVPFFLQTGGSADGEGGERENDLFDALLLGARRISHAYALHRHPRMVEAVRDKRILIEMGLPTASGGDNNTLHNHPLSVLMAQGVPCALTVDDSESLEGIPESGPRTTAVFWQALQAWGSIDLAGLGSLAENSVRWAAFEDQNADVWTRDVREASVGAGVKAARLRQWAVEWERFCLWIVTEYGEAHEEGGTHAVE
ncbi:hypothetical protein N0V88_000904 [Collariella sp. IMI 366227]|nr:hypothetical protein N0V88_000904 [Collariella sp. IMI 366227]